MPRNREDLLKDLTDGVFLLDDALAVKDSHEVVGAQYDAYEAINQGVWLREGIRRACFFEKEEYFVPESLLCSAAMYAGIEVLRPHIKTSAERQKYLAVIGVMEGDTHDIGKNLVKIMMDAAGFEVHDLGRNVSAASLVSTAKSVGAHLICMSTLMTTTMENMGAGDRDACR
jgi:methanogenic corrinoid protein MtbC1